MSSILGDFERPGDRSSSRLAGTKKTHFGAGFVKVVCNEKPASLPLAFRWP